MTGKFPYGTAGFIVHGEPVGKGRPRAFRTKSGVGMYTPKKTSSYEDKVRAACREQSGNYFCEGPIFLTVEAFFGIPKSMPKADRVRAEAEKKYVTKKPDHDNIGKIISDALNGIAYDDDAQVCYCHTVKKYSLHPRVEVRYWTADENY